MVQPIEYTPQFIKTDVGAIQDKLNARQGQYDTAYASTLGAEDQFGQYDVHARDIDLKNKVIGGFKDRVKSLVDQYGGDYAAASKQLVKEIINTKNDKFFKLASLRNKYAEEQRRTQQQLGPNAIVMKDVLAKDLMDADGKYINPEDLQTEVLNREQFKEMANKEYGYLAKDVQEGKFGQSEVAGLLKRQIRTGITAQQVPEVANNIYGLLKKQRPDLPEDIAQSIAMEEARSYVGDIKHDYQGDPGYVKPTASKGAGDGIIPPGRTPNLFTERTSDAAGVVSDRTNEVRVSNTTINNGARMINEGKQNIANLEKQYNNNYASIKSANPTWPDYKIKEEASRFGTGHIPSLILAEKIKLQKGRELYSSGQAKFKENKVYNDLVSSGVNEAEARSIVMKNVDETDNVFASGVNVKAPDHKLVTSAFAGIQGGLKKKNPDGTYSNSEETFASLGLDKNENYSTFVIKPGKEEAVWVHKDGTEYSLPLSKSKNKDVVKATKQYRAVKDASQGKYGLGWTKINTTQDGDTRVMPMGKNRIGSDGLYVLTKYENGQLISKVVDFKNGQGMQGDLNDFAGDYLNNVSGMLGVKTEIQPDKVVVE